MFSARSIKIFVYLHTCIHTYTAHTLFLYASTAWSYVRTVKTFHTRQFRMPPYRAHVSNAFTAYRDTYTQVPCRLFQMPSHHRHSSTSITPHISLKITAGRESAERLSAEERAGSTAWLVVELPKIHCHGAGWWSNCPRFIVMGPVGGRTAQDSLSWGRRRRRSFFHLLHYKVLINHIHSYSPDRDPNAPHIHTIHTDLHTVTTDTYAHWDPPNAHVNTYRNASMEHNAWLWRNHAIHRHAALEHVPDRNPDSDIPHGTLHARFLDHALFHLWVGAVGALE